MPTRIRFEHGYIPEIRKFHITSPDIRGFFTTGDTYEQTEREALAMAAVIHSQSLEVERGKLDFVQFDEA